MIDKRILIWMNIMALCLVTSVVTMHLTVKDEMKHMQIKEPHQCREFILWSGDTLEVIYTRHEYTHFRKHNVKPQPKK